MMRQRTAALMICALLTTTMASAADGGGGRATSPSPPPGQAQASHRWTVRGTLIGAGTGLVVAALMTDCSQCDRQTTAADRAAVIAIGAGVGATIGYFVDRAHRPRKDVAIAPIVRARSTGVRLLIRWP